MQMLRPRPNMAEPRVYLSEMRKSWSASAACAVPLYLLATLDAATGISSADGGCQTVAIHPAGLDKWGLV